MPIVVRHNWVLAILGLATAGLLFLGAATLGSYLVVESIRGNPLEYSPLAVPRWAVALIGVGLPTLIWWEFRSYFGSGYGYFETYSLDNTGVVVTHRDGTSEALAWTDIEGGVNPLPALVRLNSGKLRRPIALWITAAESPYPLRRRASSGAYVAAVRLAKQKLGDDLVLIDLPQWVA